KANICRCNNGEVRVGSQVNTVSANKPALMESLRDLIQADPGSRWDPTAKQVIDGSGNPVTESPRIIKVVLYDPRTATGGALDVVNIGMMFVERLEGPNNNEAFAGRFMVFTAGTGEGS